jgi:hypothetical protein
MKDKIDGFGKLILVFLVLFFVICITGISFGLHEKLS